jgi:hypothetical protein
MRKIKIESWEGRLPNGEKIQETIMDAINGLINAKPVQELPRGIEKFRIFSKIVEAFEKASETKVLVLEEREYDFIKKMIEQDVPSVWGMNPNIMKAVEDFLSAKQE